MANFFESLAKGVGGALTGLVGGLFGSHSAKSSADKTAQSQLEAVNRQLAWERERATNAHQWEVQDLRNAGLNPILSNGGSGAVTSGIASPFVDYSNVANSAVAGFNAGSDSFSKGLTAFSAKQQADTAENLSKSQSVLNIANAGLAEQNMINSAKQFEKIEAEIRSQNAYTKSLEAQAYATRKNADSGTPWKSGVTLYERGKSAVEAGKVLREGLRNLLSGRTLRTPSFGHSARSVGDYSGLLGGD